MKHLLLLLPVLFVLSSCHVITGSGNIITDKRAPGNFTGISVGGDFEVELINGPSAEVTVEADDNVMPYIETRVNGSILKIRTKNLHSYSNVHMKVYITAPDITDITVSASASLFAKDVLKSDGRLSFHASSSGSITAEVDAPEVDNSASSAGTIKISGKTKSYSADASSGANLKATDLLSENTRVNASSGASAHVHASINLTANASSGGNISYHGGANVQKTTSSGGSVNRSE